VERQSATRVPELVPIRYGRMTGSPFRFHRGAAAMAADLAGTPVTGITTQLCGDAHLLNFRLLASPERHLLFDIDDFDETLPGPWEWDVERLRASLVIAARANGFDAAERAAAPPCAGPPDAAARPGGRAGRQLRSWSPVAPSMSSRRMSM
jgi:uncharacterized protein (DUF2252 family)